MSCWNELENKNIEWMSEHISIPWMSAQIGLSSHLRCFHSSRI